MPVTNRMLKARIGTMSGGRLSPTKPTKTATFSMTTAAI
jgi:hypothetical protein